MTFVRPSAFVLAVCVPFAACVGNDPVPGAASTETDAGARPPANDGGIDAAEPPTDGAVSGFCERRGSSVSFCADFDHAEKVLDGWTVAEVRGNADSPQLATIANSPPQSMVTAVHYEPDGGADVAISRVSFQRPYGEQATTRPAMSVEFALYIDIDDDDPRNVSIANLEGVAQLGLHRTAGAGSMMELVLTSGGQTVGTLPGISPRAWTTVTLTVPPRSPSPDGGTVGGGVTIGVGDQQKSFALTPQELPATFRADVGLGFSNLTGGEWKVYFDDILIDGAPLVP